VDHAEDEVERVHPDQKETPASPVLQDQTVRWDLRVPRVHEDLLACLDRSAIVEKMVHQDMLVKEDHPVKTEILVHRVSPV
jgi:hypothetical protein